LFCCDLQQGKKREGIRECNEGYTEDEEGRVKGEGKGGKGTSNIVSGKRRLGGGQAEMREGLESGRVEYRTSLKVQSQLRACPVTIRYNSVLVY
jgi:hypothetical protein